MADVAQLREALLAGFVAAAPDFSPGRLDDKADLYYAAKGLRSFFGLQKPKVLWVRMGMHNTNQPSLACVTTESGITPRCVLYAWGATLQSVVAVDDSLRCECKDHGHPVTLGVRGERIPVTLPVPHGPTIALLVQETKKLMKHVGEGHGLGSYPPDRGEQQPGTAIPRKPRGSSFELWLDSFKRRHRITCYLGDSESAQQAWISGDPPLLEWFEGKGYSRKQAEEAVRVLGVRDLLDLGPRPDLECLRWLPSPSLVACRQALPQDLLLVELLDTARKASSAAFSGMLGDRQVEHLFQYELSDEVAPIFRLWDQRFSMQDGRDGISEMTAQPAAADSALLMAAGGGAGAAELASPLPSPSLHSVWTDVASVKADDLTEIRNCGCGAYGVVFQGCLNGQRVAVKGCDVLRCGQLAHIFEQEPRSPQWAWGERLVQGNVERELKALHSARMMDNVVRLVGAYPFEDVGTEPPPSGTPGDEMNDKIKRWYEKNCLTEFRHPMGEGADIAEAEVHRFDRRFGLVVMEHAGTSLDVLVSGQVSGLTWRALTVGQFFELALGAANGLRQLHRGGMVHADVALRNIMWAYDDVGGTSKIVTTIGDLGMAGKLNDGAAYIVRTGDRGPTWEGAPECFPVWRHGERQRRICQKGDVFAFAVALSTLWTGVKPGEKCLCRGRQLKLCHAGAAQADLDEQAPSAAAAGGSDVWNYADVLFEGVRVEAPAGSSGLVRSFTERLGALLLHCTRRLPSERPSMQRTYEELEQLARDCRPIANTFLSATVQRAGANGARR